MLKGLLARESTMTTYLGHGVALPHVREQPLQQRLRLQIRKLSDAHVEQFLQRALQIEALQIDDAAPGDDLVEPHALFDSTHFSHCSAPFFTSYTRPRINTPIKNKIGPRIAMWLARNSR